MERVTECVPETLPSANEGAQKRLAQEKESALACTAETCTDGIKLVMQVSTGQPAINNGGPNVESENKLIDDRSHDWKSLQIRPVDPNPRQVSVVTTAYARAENTACYGQSAVPRAASADDKGVPELPVQGGDGRPRRPPPQGGVVTPSVSISNDALPSKNGLFHYDPLVAAVSAMSPIGSSGNCAGTNG